MNEVSPAPSPAPPPECRKLFGKTKSRIKAQLQSLNNEQLEYIEMLDKSPDPDTAESRFTSGYPNSPVVLYDQFDSLFNVYKKMLEAGPKEVRSHVDFLVYRCVRGQSDHQHLSRSLHRRTTSGNYST